MVFMDRYYFLDVGESIEIEDLSVVQRNQDSYKVWPSLSPMPVDYKERDILENGSFETVLNIHDAFNFSREIGNSPVYHVRVEEEGKRLAVIRIR
jgi:hypothetical protein